MKYLIAQTSVVDFNKISEKAFPGLKSEFRPAGGPANISIIIGDIIPYIFVFAGLILLFILISGGLQMMANASDEKAAAAAKTKITSALTGFVLLFCSYWIFRIVLKILGIEGF